MAARTTLVAAVAVGAAAPGSAGGGAVGEEVEEVGRRPRAILDLEAEHAAAASGRSGTAVEDGSRRQ